ncbi:MAG: hypothetical protein J4N96_00315 [Chloroflexi bacterium]|nr:hypothetical protein [Chloroflexota bacterium]MCI0834240.1 hypothetical protein [Chloroflexota bacterium]MCI0835610.1 hypothetical protein [Chloroflexota bacterium]
MKIPIPAPFDAESLLTFDILPSHPIEPGLSLIRLENVMPAPHNGGHTAETAQRHSQAMSEDPLRFSQGDNQDNFVKSAGWGTRRGAT